MTPKCNIENGRRLRLPLAGLEGVAGVVERNGQLFVAGRFGRSGPPAEATLPLDDKKWTLIEKREARISGLWSLTFDPLEEADAAISDPR
jgi:hypothetical protein